MKKPVMRGIGNLMGARRTATTQIARDAVAAMQRQRKRQASHDLALRVLRRQYGDDAWRVSFVRWEMPPLAWI